MKYYFNIADIKLIIDSEIEIDWNDYIKAFLTAPFDKFNEYYQCILTSKLEPKGSIIYRDDNLIVFKNGQYEERLHFFVGQNDPCMLYVEREDRKVIYLNEQYLTSFTRNNNYCIFNALAFEKVLMKCNAVVLHCSYIVHDDEAILFTAPSGTGKSTQAGLWEKYKKSTIVNGDRAIIKKVDGKYYAFGMPICGSSDICLDERTPIRAIVNLSKSTENFIEEIGLKERTKKLISEITINFFNNEYVDKAFDIICDIASNVDMYYLACTKDVNAVNTLEKKIGGGRD